MENKVLQENKLFKISNNISIYKEMVNQIYESFNSSLFIVNVKHISKEYSKKYKLLNKLNNNNILIVYNKLNEKFILYGFGNNNKFGLSLDEIEFKKNYKEFAKFKNILSSKIYLVTISFRDINKNILSKIFLDLKNIYYYDNLNILFINKYELKIEAYINNENLVKIEAKNFINKLNLNIDANLLTDF